MENNDFNFLHDATSKMMADLSKQFDDIVIKGLHLKGHDFHNQYELHDFIKTRCSCLDDQMLKQRVYSIDDVPFLLHNYKIDIKFDNDDSYTISASLGTYTYL